MNFWRFLPHSAFKRNPTRESTGGHRKSTRGKQGNYRRHSRGGREQFSLFLGSESGCKRWIKVGMRC